MVKINIPAKLNLVLSVTGKIEEKHTLDGIYVPFAVYDIVEITKRADDEITLRYVGKNGIYDNDVALRMALAIKIRYNLGGFDIIIQKNIPEKCGLGGSSADGAGVARGLQKLFDLPEIDTRLLLSVGSDVPYMYFGGEMRVKGLGDTLESITLPKVYKVVLLPKTGVSTAECFKLYDEIGGDAVDVDRFLREGATNYQNSLLRAASKLNGQIEEALSILKKCGFSAGMTGSGSAVFGIESDVELFEKKLNALQKTSDGYVVLVE